MDPGQKALILIAFEYGRLACERGARAVPALDKNINAMISSVTSGKPATKTVGFTVKLLTAWHRGWATANLAAPLTHSSLITHHSS